MAEKSWIEDRHNEVRKRIIKDIDWLLDEKEALQQDRDAYSREIVRLERALGIAKEGLVKAIETIESWHNMHLPCDLKDGLWERYQQSPEMKRINAALKAATEELQK